MTISTNDDILAAIDESLSTNSSVTLSANYAQVVNALSTTEYEHDRSYNYDGSVSVWGWSYDQQEWELLLLPDRSED